ncbi:hypothetical protein ACRAR1_16710 [Streptomyces sanyensis]|uniref:hypothetical protein n=1 Tax=Streptomyces sanyensis TaxID=568869 RepID=UPI003D782D44
MELGASATRPGSGAVSWAGAVVGDSVLAERLAEGVGVLFRSAGRRCVPDSCGSGAPGR